MGEHPLHADAEALCRAARLLRLPGRKTVTVHARVDGEMRPYTPPRAHKNAQHGRGGKREDEPQRLRARRLLRGERRREYEDILLHPAMYELRAFVHGRDGKRAYHV